MTNITIAKMIPITTSIAIKTSSASMMFFLSLVGLEVEVADYGNENDDDESQ